MTLYGALQAVLPSQPVIKGSHQIGYDKSWIIRPVRAKGARMTNIEIYRANAAAQREAAQKTNLPNRRAMHERSAQTWEALAANAADTVARAGVNEAAKAGLAAANAG